jgi:hypothetical protein
MGEEFGSEEDRQQKEEELNRRKNTSGGRFRGRASLLTTVGDQVLMAIGRRWLGHPSCR